MTQPTPADVRKAKKAQLLAWSESLGLETKGTVPELRERILEHLGELAPEKKETTERTVEEARQARKRPKAAPEEAESKPEATQAELGAAPKEEAEMEIEEEPEPEAAEEETEPEEEVREKGKAVHTPKAKPKLEAATQRALKLRKEIASRRPAFRPQEWFRYKRLGEKWRKPQGMHSKLHRHFGYRPNMVSIGYRGPKGARGLHPSGFREVLVHNARELDRVDPKVEAARIARTVGMRKRLELQAAADEKGVRVLNRSEEE